LKATLSAKKAATCYISSALTGTMSNVLARDQVPPKVQRVMKHFFISSNNHLEHVYLVGYNDINGRYRA